MKTRIISALVGIGILFTVLMMFDTIILNIGISVVIVLSIYEVISASGVDKKSPIMAASLLAGAVVAFLPMTTLPLWLLIVTFLYVTVVGIILLKEHKTTKASDLAVSVIATGIISISMVLILVMRHNLGAVSSLYFTAVALMGAWGTDTGAYFVGVTMGKHKLCPEISPKKTVEGAIGGIVICIILMGILTFIAELISPSLGFSLNINYPIILAITPVLSVLGMVGDLIASAIKRQYGVKDFGNIMPGHGGALDRFDSVLMVLPAVFIASIMLPILI